MHVPVHVIAVHYHFSKYESQQSCQRLLVQWIKWSTVLRGPVPTLGTDVSVRTCLIWPSDITRNVWDIFFWITMNRSLMNTDFVKIVNGRWMFPNRWWPAYVYILHGCWKVRCFTGPIFKSAKKILKLYSDLGKTASSTFIAHVDYLL